jgi:ATP-dependent Clp protease ATP-binding subunit ClpA
VNRFDYNVVMSRREPTPVRFDPHVAARLSSWASARPGLSLSSAANQLVDEALRTEEHPGVVFRPGPTGRRAGLSNGPDVWEVVQALRSARHSEPELAEDEVLALVSGNTGVPTRQIDTAIRYWSRYPEEVDAKIAANEAAEEQAEAAVQRRHELLSRR